MNKKNIIIRVLATIFISFLLWRDINNIVKYYMITDFVILDWIAMLLVILFYTIFYPILLYGVWSDKKCLK